MYGADSAMVVTNAQFTNQARRLAAKTEVELWGRDELVAALLKGQKAKVAAPVLEQATPAPPPTPVAPPAASLTETTAVAECAPAVAGPSGAFCARCGEPVSMNVRDYCLANAARFAGLVYCYGHQRSFKRA